MEIVVEHGGGEQSVENPQRAGAHVRLGWARREAPLNAPCGLDGYSYGVRDKTGEKVTLSRPRPYGQPFGTGDVIGMYISLPSLRRPSPNDPHDPAHIKRERIAIEFKGQEYFEALEYTQTKEMMALMDVKATDSTSLPSSSKKSATVKNVPERGRGTHSAPEPSLLRPLPVLPGSYAAFFINGSCPGPAFRDLYDFIPLPVPASTHNGQREKKRAKEGAREHKENPFDDGYLGYYPFISLFNNARVRLNPGPDFAFPPPPDVDALFTEGAEPSVEDGKERAWRPLCERYAEFMAEQWELDKKEEESARTEAAERAEAERAEAEKKAQRERKRAQAEARKREKRMAETAVAGSTVQDSTADPETSLQPQDESAMSVEDDRFGPNVSIPLEVTQARYLLPTTAPDLLTERTNSPAPTVDSSVDILGAQSGYNSESVGVAEPEEDEEEEEESETTAAYAAYGPYQPYPHTQHYHYRSGVVAIRMEEEEEEA